MFKITSLFFFLFAFATLVNAQDFDINMSNYGKTDYCQAFNKRFFNRPNEVGFNVVRKGDLLYLRVTSKEWLTQLMTSSWDGIAVDVLSQEQYACGATLPNQQIRGTLLEPVFRDKLLKNLQEQDDRSWHTLVGTVPADLKDHSLEFNILFLNDRSLCQYYNIYNLKGYPWELLDMGIYLDEVVYKNNGKITQEDEQATKYKTFNFIIPFEKNKSDYLPVDVKPIYDSLDLTDYKVYKLKINAYASVEGSTAINDRLQRARGESIIKALKSYTGEEVITEVLTSENWAEFFESVKQTQDQDLLQLSKAEIKKKLEGSAGARLEPLLAQQRKGVVSIDLIKKEIFKGMSNMELVNRFNTQLKKGDLENAMALQKALLDRSLTAKDPGFLEKMQIPQQAKYADFNNNQAVFGYYRDARNALIARNKLQEILQVAPKNKKVNYNLTAINVHLFRYDFKGIKENELKKQIKALKKLGISNNLMNRMLLNVEIIRAEKSNRARDYTNKNKAVRAIKLYYKNIPLSNSDYLSLAQFLNYYDNVESSKELLDPVVRQVDVDEDLLFYYLNQTIVSNTNVARNDYRVILSNAYAQNPNRFCQLFDASTEGGVTFQLLNNDYLRKTYCENCGK